MREFVRPSAASATPRNRAAPQRRHGWRVTLLWISAVCLLPALLLGESELEEGLADRLIERIGHRLSRSAVAYQADFDLWPTHVAKHREAIDGARTREELGAALGAAVEEFDMSHLRLFSPQQARSLRRGMRTGIGISARPVKSGLFVTYVIEGSPAWESGIRKLDTLTTIDGAHLQSLRQVVGQVGDIRRIGWTRGDRPFEADIRYQPFRLAERSSMQWLNEEVALIKIHSFQFRFYRMARINHFFREARKAKAVILDLRNNHGGLALYSQHLASKVSPCSAVYALRVHKRAFRQAQRAESTSSPSLKTLAAHARKTRPLPFSFPYKGQVVVLVDELSASGADLFPAFIQESGRGIVIGERTGGALQLARTFALPHGFRLYVPTAEVLTPSGRRLEKDGLHPDILLGFRETANDGFIYKTALRWIESPTGPAAPATPIDADSRHPSSPRRP